MDVGHLLTSIPKQHRYQHVARATPSACTTWLLRVSGFVLSSCRRGHVDDPSGPTQKSPSSCDQGVRRWRTSCSLAADSSALMLSAGKVRRARLYYQRGRTGRRARIKTGTRARRIIEESPVLEADAPIVVAEDDVVEEEVVDEAVEVEDDVVAEAEEEAEASAETEEAPERQRPRNPRNRPIIATPQILRKQSKSLHGGSQRIAHSSPIPWHVQYLHCAWSSRVSAAIIVAIAITLAFILQGCSEPDPTPTPGFRTDEQLSPALIAS